MPFGAQAIDSGATRFRLWAPGEAAVDVELEIPGGTVRRRLRVLENGWHEIVCPDAPPGTLYRLHLSRELTVPDPASRFNPRDVHGPSEVIDPHAYAWRNTAWHGRPWEEAVLYELHVGAFTPEGTFTAARARLPELAALGITAIELMPVADFPGARNWGYDGVLAYAPDAAYGRPEELKALVDEAHAQGLMVLLDVVYNHFGPEGNYLHAYCPEFFNAARQTPWGAAINFDGPHSRAVRDFFVHNALYWVEEYCFDGLRLDAVHAIRDSTDPDIVLEIARALADGPGRERHVHLVLENDANETRYLGRSPGLATAQWNDDVHHALHVIATGEYEGYYADFAEAPIGRLGRALAEGFSWQGEPSAYRGGMPRGAPSRHLPPGAFVSFLQSHDQVGNRAFGERIHALADPRMLAAAYVCTLLSPQIPMLFMGEEFAASSPFLFFCDFGPELAQAVAKGRREEFKRFAAFRDAAARAGIPDPNAPETFNSSKLDWRERTRPVHRERLALVQHLLSLRRRHLVPRLPGMRSGGNFTVDGETLHVNWTLGDGSRWHLLAHFGHCDIELPDMQSTGEVIHSTRAHDREAAGLRLEPGAVRVILEPAHG